MQRSIGVNLIASKAEVSDMIQAEHNLPREVCDAVAGTVMKYIVDRCLAPEDAPEKLWDETEKTEEVA